MLFVEERFEVCSRVLAFEELLPWFLFRKESLRIFDHPLIPHLPDASILFRCQFLYEKIEKRHWCLNEELIFTYNFTSKSAFTLLPRNAKICTPLVVFF